MLNPTMKTFRLSKLTPPHVTAQSALVSTGKTVAQIATTLAIMQDDCERKLSLLVDEGLAFRSVGTRTTALYTSL